MARIALTGAAGRIGRGLLDAYDDHDLRPFTHSEQDDVDSEALDVTDGEAVLRTLDDADVVVHLAGAAAVDTDWETAVDVNLHGTKHVLEAAVENDIDRVVYASSNHAVGTYNAADPTDPEGMTTGDTRTIHADASPRPDSFYGVSKAASEALCNFHADVHGLEIVNLRIGAYTDADGLREWVADAAPEADRFARAIWLSPRDCRDVHRKAVTADLPRSPVTLNAISRNTDRVHSITETMRVLGYEPRDDSAEVLGDVDTGA